VTPHKAAEPPDDSSHTLPESPEGQRIRYESLDKPPRGELKGEYPELEDEDIAQALDFATRNLDDQILRWKRRDPAAARPGSRSTVELLRADGWDVVHACQCGLGTASDEQILEYARTNNRVVCTLDADLHKLLQYRARRALRLSAYAGRAARTGRRIAAKASLERSGRPD